MSLTLRQRAILEHLTEHEKAGPAALARAIDKAGASPVDQRPSHPAGAMMSATSLVKRGAVVKFLTDRNRVAFRITEAGRVALKLASW